MFSTVWGRGGGSGTIMDCPVLCLSRSVVCTIFGSLGSWMGGWLVSLCLVRGLGYFSFLLVGGGWGLGDWGFVT